MKLKTHIKQNGIDQIGCYNHRYIDLSFSSSATSFNSIISLKYLKLHSRSRDLLFNLNLLSNPRRHLSVSSNSLNLRDFHKSSLAGMFGEAALTNTLRVKLNSLVIPTELFLSFFNPGQGIPRSLPDFLVLTNNRLIYVAESKAGINRSNNCHTSKKSKANNQLKSGATFLRSIGLSVHGQIISICNFRDVHSVYDSFLYLEIKKYRQQRIRNRTGNPLESFYKSFACSIFLSMHLHNLAVELMNNGHLSPEAEDAFHKVSANYFEVQNNIREQHLLTDATPHMHIALKNFLFEPNEENLKSLNILELQTIFRIANKIEIPEPPITQGYMV